MSQHDEHKKAQDRARQRRQRAAARRARNRLILACLALVATGGLILFLSLRARQDPAGTEPSASSAATTVQTPATTEPAATEPVTVIHIAAAGDLNVTDRVVASGANGGTYDYSQVFSDVSPLLAAADLTVLNFEGNLSGTPYGLETGSAPTELAQALKNAGVDLVQTANSASIRAGLLGLTSTLNTLEQVGLDSLGTYETNADFRSGGGYIIREVNGVRIAFVAFTKGMDSLGLPDGSENCVNVLYTDYASTYKEVNTQKITSVLRAAAAEQPDITIVMLHWGSEYNDQISSSQLEIRDLLLSEGADIILGTHPHLVQTIDFDEENGTLVAYSLGDFFGDGTQAGSAYSLILDLEITKDNNTGRTKLTGYSYTPIYTLQPEDSFTGQLQVVRIQEAMALYEDNFIGRVSKTVYDNMSYSLERIEARVSAEVD